MDDNIATAPRNFLRIKARKSIYLGFQACDLLSERLSGRPKDSKTILLYPELTDDSDIADVLNRLGWYFPKNKSTPNKIYIPVNSDVGQSAFTESPQGQPKYDHDHLPIEFVSATEGESVIDEADRILLHDFYQGFGRSMLMHAAKVKIIDPEYYSSVESTDWLDVGNELREVDGDSSREVFERLEHEYSSLDDSFVFATGPSLERAYDFEFPEDSLKIICNSIVKNEELVSHIDPDVLVFADPVFHFGPSLYAHKFRQDAVQILQAHECFAVVPKHLYGLLSGHYPSIEDQLIGMERVSSEVPRYPSRNSLDVATTDNIMTMFMLPVASAMTDNIHIMGADGRKEDESYFWEHSEEAQYDDEMMQTVVDTHPSFFRDRIYADYYDKHVQTLEDMIKYGEQQEKNYYNLTNSYVPCLKERTVDPTEIGLR